MEKKIRIWKTSALGPTSGQMVQCECCGVILTGWGWDGTQTERVYCPVCEKVVTATAWPKWKNSKEEESFLNQFQDMSLICVTGGCFPEGLDWERVGNSDFIIGWLDAPDFIAAGYCSRSEDFLGLRMLPEYVNREDRKYRQ